MRRPWILLFLSVLYGPGCSGRSVGPSPVFGAATDEQDAYAGELGAPDASTGEDAGYPVASPSQSSPTGVTDAGDVSSLDAAMRTNGAAEAGPNDAGPEGTCALPIGPGDLAIDELMIESVAGAGDYGEWIEVRSNLDCMANLRGLHGECPRGAKVATFDVSSDLWLPARGTFVIADSSDPAINHDLPGLVIVWFGQPGDVLRNKGSTVTLSLHGALLDTVTYPALSLTVGDSWSFPDDCDPSLRSDFMSWARSTASWFPGFLGTPNQPNTDVACSGPGGDP